VITKPGIHTNGTSADRLLEGYRIAYRAVTDALAALQESAAPHPRDFYPLGWVIHHAAMEEHKSRLAALQKTQEELLELMEHCSAGRRVQLLK
jgi:hypothetical protein